MNKEKPVKGFFRMTCQDYFVPTVLPDNVTEIITVENRFLDGSVLYEFNFTWFHLGKEEPAAQLQIFEDAFIAFKDNDELFKSLSDTNNPSPDDIHKILLDLGYKDFSDRKLDFPGHIMSDMCNGKDKSSLASRISEAQRKTDLVKISQEEYER